jgi:hypothetical protein
MLKLSLKKARKTGVGQKKFFCEHKHKFGLNSQAVSDCQGLIPDIFIQYASASASCLAHEASDL